MKIAIIGAGFFGTTAALKLSKSHDVDLFEKKINHKSKIKLLSTDLDKIKKETIPGKYKTSPIIGRIRVVNTYLQKIDSYLLNQENLDEYKIDLKNLVE